MKQQTAVEWLTDEMIKRDFFNKDKNLSFTTFEHLVNEAKKMEKEQIIKAIDFGQTNHTVSFVKDREIAEKYYNSTYTKSLE